MQGPPPGHGSAEPLWRAIAIFRFASLGYAALLAILDRVYYVRFGWAWAVIAAMTASAVRAALDNVRRVAGAARPDVVVLDLQLPDMSASGSRPGCAPATPRAAGSSPTRCGGRRAGSGQLAGTAVWAMRSVSFRHRVTVTHGLQATAAG
ncbi:MAG TPA: DUF5931 domain-containing protein [Streptosporangiaceae bacterium]|nr:DUF5931 domain-containing protein [Streptosporangiaceae bacterium]